MIEFIKKIFHRTVDKKEWLDPLFSALKSAWMEDRPVHCKIVGIKKTGFSVKTGGLFAFLPFQLMPWQYPYLAYWYAAFPALEGKVFYCKITDVTKVEKRKFHILIDATTHRFKKIELENAVEYTGIVLKNYSQGGMIVDIGCHFDWRYGSITGYLSMKKVYGTKSFKDYEAGDRIKVVYNKCTENKRLFIESSFNDFYMKYVGSTIWAKVCKNENGLLSFLVEGEYPADLSITKKHRQFIKKWKDGDIIDCKILNFSVRQGFIIRWVKPEEAEMPCVASLAEKEEVKTGRRSKKIKEREKPYTLISIEDSIDEKVAKQLYELVSKQHA